MHYVRKRPANHDWLCFLGILVLVGCSTTASTPSGGGPDAQIADVVDGGAVTDAGKIEDAGTQETDAGPEGTDAGTDAVTVSFSRVDTLFANPNMGFANFHFGWWCNLPPITFTAEECAQRVRSHWPTNHPESGVAYFRWLWRDLEPQRGQLNFALIDATIQTANLLDETLGIRVMAIDTGSAGVPDWLRQTPYSVPGVTVDGTFWPDYRNPVFQAEHRRFLAALAARYDGHPAIDHLDIGTVGCWGEWNTACLTNAGSIIDVLHPATEADRDAIAAGYRQAIDDHIDAFRSTPLVMLAQGGPGRELDLFVHALRRGAGWRVDCWGDWAWFSTNWSHQTTIYPAMIASATAAYPAFPDTWKHAPVQLEVCGTIQGWHDKGWTTTPPDGYAYKSFQWALDQHAAVLNGKFGPIPSEYVPALNDLRAKNGYRYAIDTLTHPRVVRAGGELKLASTWTNLGVTPSYTRRTLAYRLVGPGGTRVFESNADVRTWLPGTWTMDENFQLAGDLAAGTYDVEVAILDRAGTNPTTSALPPLFLAIDGRGEEGWYALSKVQVE